MNRHAEAVVNVYEAQARAAKVAKILRVIPVGTTSDANARAAMTMATWSAEDWSAVAGAAGVRPPSEETRRHVIEAVRTRVMPANDRIPF